MLFAKIRHIRAIRIKVFDFSKAMSTIICTEYVMSHYMVE